MGRGRLYANGIEKTILAEDFHGTSPSGSLYSKQEALADAQNEKRSEEACTLYEVKVHSSAIRWPFCTAARARSTRRPTAVGILSNSSGPIPGSSGTVPRQVVAAQDMPLEEVTHGYSS